MQRLTLKMVSKRRKDLVRYGLWDLPRADVIEAWCQQFSSSQDEKFALIALDALIVRSRQSALSSLWYMFCSVLPNILGERIFNPANCGAIPHDLLRRNQFARQLKIQRLERPTDNPLAGQSSDDIIRDLRSNHAVNSKYFDMPDSETTQVLLVDEFSGSGKQAKDAITDWKNSLSSSVNISVFFMAVHEKGLKVIMDEFPDVGLYTTEILGKESCLLNHIKRQFNISTVDETKSVLKEFVKRNFVRESGIRPLGYRDMSLCFKPPYTACNNMAGVYLLKTKNTNVRLFERGF